MIFFLFLNENLYVVGTLWNRHKKKKEKCNEFLQIPKGKKTKKHKQLLNCRCFRVSSKHICVEIFCTPVLNPH